MFVTYIFRVQYWKWFVNGPCNTPQVTSFSSNFETVGLSPALDWYVNFQMSDEVKQRALFDVSDWIQK
jgi:hypothetical protein